MDNSFTEIPEEFRTTLQKVREEQKQLAQLLEVQRVLPLTDVRLVTGFDAAFDEKNDFACSAAVTVDIQTFETVESHFTYFKPPIPYIPTFLFYREGMSYKTVYQELKEEPDVLFFDGNGILHPYGCGLASQMAIELQKPTVGIAKKLLLGTYEPPLRKGGYSKILYNGKIVGAAFQSLPPPARPIFISPGNLLDIKTAVNITRFFTQNQKYQIKLPLPLFLAHKLANEKLKKS